MASPSRSPVAGSRRFVKWAPAWSGVDPTVEADRLSWAAAFTPVPAVLGSGGDDSGTWLITAALPGDSAVSARWKRSPRAAVTAVGQGLRALHEALPVDRCPFSWSVDDRLAEARRRASFGLIDQMAWHQEHQHLPVDRALAELDDAPAVDRLVVCHGDACAPNTLLGADGRWTGHVDLGALGVGDRWADLAVATWSTRWNFGPGWEDCLLSAYGVDRRLGTDPLLPAPVGPRTVARSRWPFRPGRRPGAGPGRGRLPRRPGPLRRL